MTIPMIAACAAALLSQSLAIPADQPPLSLVKSIPLPGVRGRIDHMDYEADTGRLFVAAIGNGSLEVVDIAKGERISSVGDLPEPQDVAFLGHRKGAVASVIVTCGGDGTARVLNSDTLAPIASVRLADDADNIQLASLEAYIACGTGDSAAIARFSIDDQTTLEKSIARWPMKGHPEGLCLLASPWPEDRGQAPSQHPASSATRVIVNVPSAHEVASIDLSTGTVAHWPLKHASANYPICAIQPTPADPASPDRIIVGCRQPATLLLLDASNGHELASAPCAHDVDNLLLPADHSRLFAICGGDGGAIDCYTLTPDSITPSGRIATAPGARTGTTISLADHPWAIAIAAPARDTQPAEIRIYAPPQPSK